MTAEILDRIIQESVQKAKSLPDGSSRKEHILEGIRFLEQAREKLRNSYNDRNEINWLISQGLTLIYYEQQHQHIEVRVSR